MFAYVGMTIQVKSKQQSSPAGVRGDSGEGGGAGGEVDGAGVSVSGEVVMGKRVSRKTSSG